MKKTRNNHPSIAPTIGNYVRSIRAGDLLFISGCTAVNTPEEEADVLAQAAVTLDRIKRIVEAEGGKPSDVVRMVVYVTDMNAFRPLISKFDTLVEGVFKGEYPTSTLVASPGLARPGLKIEIEATAAL